MSITRIDVRTKSIQELMDEGEIPSGRYWLPSFQRSYVWDSDKIKDLLDSIFHNYPIGSVILWRPSSRAVSDIDPTAVPLIDVGNNSQEPHFVIDGQQRMTSLLLLFHGWRIGRNGNEVKCDPISYDPNSNAFIKSAHRGIDFSKIVKAFCLHDTDTLTELKQSTRPEIFERIRAKALQLLKYPMSQYIMQTDIEDEQTFEDMATAFIRINKEGVKIGNIELMLSFLAGTIGGDLKQRIVDIDSNMYKRFEAALQPTMRFIFSNFGLKQSQLSNARRFTSNIKHIKTIEVPKRDDILTRSTRALNLTLDFLDTETGIKSALILPSQITLVPLATYMYHRNITSVASLSEDEKRKMLEWFILANFMSHYGTAADSRLNRDIQTITDDSSENFPLEQLLANMPAGRCKISYDDIVKGMDRSVLLDAGKRYLFLLYIILIRKEADDWAGNLLSSRMISDLERHHIFPQEHLRKIFPDWEDADPDDIEVEMSNLGNITWILDSVNSAIGGSDPVDYLPQYLESAKHHFVPEDQRFWTKEGYAVFKEYRIREIYLAGKQLFSEIFTDENPEPVKYVPIEQKINSGNFSKLTKVGYKNKNSENPKEPGEYDDFFGNFRDELKKVLPSGLQPSYISPFSRKNYIQMRYPGFGPNHYELRFLKNRVPQPSLEVALHRELPVYDGLLGKIFEENKDTIRKNLGEDFKAEPWGKKWERIYKLVPLGNEPELNEKLAAEAAVQMKNFIETIQPFTSKLTR